MNKKTLLLGAMLIILPLVIGISLVYLNHETFIYGQTYIYSDSNMIWCYIWKGIKSMPIFAYIIGMFIAIKSILVKQNKGVLCSAAFAGALIVILSFVLPMFRIGFDIISVIMLHHYQLLAPLAIGNMILGIYIHRRKAISNK